MINTSTLATLVAPIVLLLPTQAQNCNQDSCDTQERAQRSSIQDPQPDGRRSDREAIRKRMLKKYDANGNGKLDRDELAQARKDGAFPGRGQQGKKPQDGEKPKDGKGQKGKKDGKGKKGKKGGESKAKKPSDGERQGPGPGIRERLLKKYDANGNGRLDREEFAKARADGALPGRGERGPQPKDGKGQGPKDGKGKKPSDGEGQRPDRAAMKERLLKKYDANGNGKLDKDELAKARKDGALDGRRRRRNDEKSGDGDDNKGDEGTDQGKRPKKGKDAQRKKRQGKRGEIG